MQQPLLTGEDGKPTITGLWQKWQNVINNHCKRYKPHQNCRQCDLDIVDARDAYLAHITRGRHIDYAE